MISLTKAAQKKEKKSLKESTFAHPSDTSSSTQDLWSSSRPQMTQSQAIISVLFKYSRFYRVYMAYLGSLAAAVFSLSDIPSACGHRDNG